MKSSLFLTLLAAAGVAAREIAVSSAPAVRSNQTILQAYDWTDIAQLGLFLASNLCPANINGTFPKCLIPNTNFLDRRRWNLITIPRAEVGNNFYRGNASNGLPDRLQGIWWMDGINFPDEVIGTGVPWDPVLRRMIITVFGTRVWGYSPTSSEKAKFGLAWLPAGASFYNAWSFTKLDYHVFMNEDISYGQIIFVFRLFNIPLFIPVFLFNWYMTWGPEGVWERVSKVFFDVFDSDTGRYPLRRIITGTGEKTEFFPAFLQYRGGEDIAYSQVASD